jgi:integrase
MTGVPALMASLLYGAGLRLLECARMRAKDVDFERLEIVVRDGKGRKDRITMLPERMMDLLRAPARIVTPACTSNPPTSALQGLFFFVDNRASASSFPSLKMAGPPRKFISRP